MNKTKSVALFLLGAGVVITGIVLLTNWVAPVTPSEPVVTSATTSVPASPKPVVEPPVSPPTVASPTPVVVPPVPQSVVPPPSGYTLAQVQTHNSAQSCWSVVGDSVYDLSTWIGKHPGGASAIKQMCGRDATADFEGQHGGERRPEKELAGFRIGAYLK